MSKLYNIKSVYSNVQSMYGIDPDPNNFEEILMNGWGQIGNKHTRLYRYIGDVKNGELQLPCNFVDIESVHVPVSDAVVTSNKGILDGIDNLLTERYVDAWKIFQEPFHQRGKLLKYKEGDDVLYFDRDYKNVMVVYHGILADEDGLPLINEREMRALSSFVAYVELYKEAIKKRNKDSLSLATIQERDWLKKCNAARSVDHLSQNDMNSILDVKYRWDRKNYGLSLKPIK